jgi:hypothetical protein
MHINDDKLDFRPSHLSLGTSSDNLLSAYANGRRDNAKDTRKPIISYIDGVFETEHESLKNAEDYLKGKGYPSAGRKNIRYGLNNDVVRYGRTWKFVTTV